MADGARARHASRRQRSLRGPPRKSRSRPSSTIPGILPMPGSNGTFRDSSRTGWQRCPIGRCGARGQTCKGLAVMGCASALRSDAPTSSPHSLGLETDVSDRDEKRWLRALGWWILVVVIANEADRPSRRRCRGRRVGYVVRPPSSFAPVQSTASDQESSRSQSAVDVQNPTVLTSGSLARIESRQQWW